jgi:hypothetical protein
MNKRTALLTTLVLSILVFSFFRFANIPSVVKATTAPFYSTLHDGHAYHFNAVWTTCHDAVTGTSIENTTTIGYAQAEQTYMIRRLFFWFSTNTIPSYATISSATLYLYVDAATTFIASATTINIQKSTAAIPLGTDDYDAFTGSSVGSATVTDVNGYVGFSITDLTVITKAGTTALVAREGTYDYADVQPSDYHQVGIRMAEYEGTGDPYIEITYDASFDSKTFSSPAYQGAVWSAWETNYDDAWTNPIAWYDDYLDIGQSYTAEPKYRVMRSMLRFDTSSLPDRATIIYANLSIWIKEDYSDDDVIIRIQNWTGGYDGIATDDFNKNGTTCYDDNNFDTSIIVIGQYNDIVFSNFSVISKTGYTDLFLRVSTDISNSTPTAKEWLRAYADNGKALSREPKLTVCYTSGANSAPTMGEFSPTGFAAYNNEYFTFNVTIDDQDVITDLKIAYITLNGSVTLKWTAPNSFSEYQDINNYCTIGTGTTTSKNATAYVLTFNLSLSDGFPQGWIDVLYPSTAVYDELTSSTTTFDNLFNYHVRVWQTVEQWYLILHGREWLLVEQWSLTLRGKTFQLAEQWYVVLGRTVYVTTKQLGLIFLIGGLGMFFGPIAVIAYKRPKPHICIALGMVMLIGLGFLLAVTYL